MSEPDDADVVKLDRVRDKHERRKQDAQAEALAAQFHRAMGWKGKPDGPAKGRKNKRKKKHS